jgi:tetratricopeptide (TPR) repeat protein
MLASRFAALFAAAILLFSSPVFAGSESFEKYLQSSSALYEQGRFQEAIPHAKKALALAERQIGIDDVAFAALLDNLAALYEARMQYDKARPLYSRALEIRVKAYGAKHPEVVNSLLNLALIYDALGDYGAAKKMDARAVEIIEAANMEEPHQG